MPAKIIASEDIPNGSMISVTRYINAPDEAYVVWNDSIFSIGQVTSFVAEGEEIIEGVNFEVHKHPTTFNAAWEDLMNIIYWPVIYWIMEKLTESIQRTIPSLRRLADWIDKE